MPTVEAAVAVGVPSFCAKMSPNADDRQRSNHYTGGYPRSCSHRSFGMIDGPDMLTAYQLSLSAGEEEPAACKTHRRTRNIAEDVGIQPWLSSPFGVPTVEEVP